MGSAGSTSHNAIEVRVLHELQYAVEILRLRIVQSDSAHGHDHSHFPVLLDVTQKYAVIVADAGAILGVEPIHEILDDKSTFARGKPLVLLLVGVDNAGSICNHW